MNAIKRLSLRNPLFTFLMLSILVLVLSFALPANAGEKLGNNSNTVSQQIGVKSPATDLWRAVRQREFKGSDALSSSTQVRSLGANELINVKGLEWRNFRMEKLVPYGAYLLGGVFLALALFRLIRGKIKIKAGRSGKKIKRFSDIQRFVHWSVAILFVLLGITGTLLTFGRSGLIPIIGSESFGVIAGVGKVIHDYLGPVFGFMLLIMLFTFIKGNFGNWTDVKWFLKGGGMFGSHASAGRYNGGEKAWFWLAILAGTVIVVSGVVLSFPYFDQTRDDLQLSHLVHAIGGIGLLAASFGHIFMGTVAMEGAYEAMRTGYCDENWAKEHHDLWFEELQKQGLVGGSSGLTGAAFAGAGAVATDAILKKSSSSSSSASAQSLMGSSLDKASSSAGSGDKGSSKANTTKALASTSTPTKPKNAATVKPSSSSKASSSNSGQADNFKKIEGIGPKIEELLHTAGIMTFSQLSESQYDDLKAILNDAGSRYKMHNPKTWSQQAKLASKGAWDELSDLQDQLLGERE